MAQSGKLQRSRDGYVAGVCLGLARFWDIDPVVVRILAVLITVVTCGVGAAIYLIMWVVIPLEPEKPRPYEVEPERVVSRTFGSVDCSKARGGSEAHAHSHYYSAGQVPPEPPLRGNAARTYAPERSTAATGRAAEFPVAAAGPKAGAGWRANASATAGAAAGHAAASDSPYGCEQGPSRGARIGLAAGLILLFFAVSFTAPPLLPGTRWWQFWPVLLLIVGLCLMVLHFESCRGAAWNAFGIILVCVGATLLPLTLGVLSWNTLLAGLSSLWVLPVGGIALFIAGFARRVAPLFFAGALCILLFCVLTLLLCSVPVTEVVVQMPDGRSIELSHFQSCFQAWGMR